MLTVKPEDYIGRLLCLVPYRGWGWFRMDDPSIQLDYGEIDRAGEFHVRVDEFFHWQGELRGFIGEVEQEAHLFNGLSFVCATMVRGEWNFTDNLCLRYDLEIGPTRPVADDGLWPQIISGSPVYNGQGIVAESCQLVHEDREAAIAEGNRRRDLNLPLRISTSDYRKRV